MSIYIAKAQRTGTRTGEVSGTPQVQALTYSAPAEFKGKDGLWTPEHFFTAALATCFVLTFEALAEFAKLPFESIDADVEGVLEKGEGGYRFTRLFVRPRLVVGKQEDTERGLQLLAKAERSCMISRSISSEIILEPQVLVAKAVER